MSRATQLVLALAALMAGLWLMYAGYGRGKSLAARAETGLAHLKTGVDGRTRVTTHHWYYAAGLPLIIGSTWWLLRAPPEAPAKENARRKRRT